MTIAAPPRCEAISAWRRLEGGQQEPVQCRQTVGIRAFAYRATPDSIGTVHHFCSRHRARVEAQARRGFRP